MIDKKDLREMLSLEEKPDIENLFEKAYQTKLRYVGNKVYFRGIIEISNICSKNCYYCGIRRDNKNVLRYDMTDNEIFVAALWAYEQHYGSIVLQSGEREDKQFTDRITNLLNTLKKKTDGKLGITLSLGEQNKDTYQKWFEAGAHRYLLRIETSNENLYRRHHPEGHSFRRRLQCLQDLQDVGYQVGTGVIVGLPHQTVDDLTEDILFFKEFDIDMIGMGPFILHKNTPLVSYNGLVKKEDNFLKTLKMIAATRIILRDVNIASTTALQAIDPIGRELGLQVGANIIMPVLTEIKYRTSYQLYEGKPCLDENAAQCRGCLEKRIFSIGEKIGYDQWGDSPHYFKKQER